MWRTGNRPRPQAGGFTLVETLVAVMFSLAAMMGILRIYGMAATILDEAAASSAADRVIRGAMAEIDSRLVTEQAVPAFLSGVSESADGRFRWKAELHPHPHVSRADQREMQEVRVTVWQDPGSRQYRQSTLISIRHVGI